VLLLARAACSVQLAAAPFRLPLHPDMGNANSRRQPEHGASSASVAEAAEALAAALAKETRTVCSLEERVRRESKAAASLEPRDEGAARHSLRFNSPRLAGKNGAPHSAPQMRRSAASPAVEAQPTALFTEEAEAEAFNSPRAGARRSAKSARNGAPHSAPQMRRTAASPAVVPPLPLPSAASRALAIEAAEVEAASHDALCAAFSTMLPEHVASAAAPAAALCAPGAPISDAAERGESTPVFMSLARDEPRARATAMARTSPAPDLLRATAMPAATPPTAAKSKFTYPTGEGDVSVAKAEDRVHRLIAADISSQLIYEADNEARATPLRGAHRARIRVFSCRCGGRPMPESEPRTQARPPHLHGSSAPAPPSIPPPIPPTWRACASVS
jgi:hypothetical protein